MSRAESQQGCRVATVELQPVLEGLLNAGGRNATPGGSYSTRDATVGDHQRRIARLERTPSPYGSSYPLEEIVVYFEDGERLDLMFKNVSPQALSPAARNAKPAFLGDPCREIEVYRNLLGSGCLGTAAYYGSVVDAAADRYWLFLERVVGRELYQVGEFDVWKYVARWLAGLHGKFASLDSLPPSAANRLVRYDADYYARWLERALAFLGERSDDRPFPELQQQLCSLERHYPAIVRDLLALPTSLIHGEFYPSNVIVQNTHSTRRVCAIDWELAAFGPGLVDLAALSTGKWSEQQRAELALEYFSALESPGNGLSSHEEFLRGVQLCRLHLAVQWLGWSSDWSPPLEHRQDWQVEAASAAKALGYLS